jgi:4-hydroxy-3-methylbut-2-enyl diphosphate reductase
MKSFDVPIFYRSPLISAIKRKRKEADRLKKDFTPTLLDLGPVKFYLARHFGFCYGVENAIEIAFRTVEENPGKKIYLISEMIHNPHVNADLRAHGIEFLQDTYGKQLIPFDIIKPGDIVMIPAFGTTLAMEKMLRDKGIHTEKYNTTCPFVERVWNKGEAIAKNNYTLIIHGKPGHEETRATFSHASLVGPALIVRDMEQAIELGNFILADGDMDRFNQLFKGQYSPGFDPSRDLQRIGVINQTTMLASDTQAIADHLKNIMIRKFNPGGIEERFADTRDTLCYATNDNQTAVTTMLETPADLAIVVGGYNSSNTSHLVELCEKMLPTFFINDESKILSKDTILHFDLHEGKEIPAEHWLPERPVKILVTSGASCPDAIVEAVLERIASVVGATPVDELLPLFSQD